MDSREILVDLLAAHVGLTDDEAHSVLDVLDEHRVAVDMWRHEQDVQRGEP